MATDWKNKESGQSRPAYNTDPWILDLQDQIKRLDTGGTYLSSDIEIQVKPGTQATVSVSNAVLTVGVSADEDTYLADDETAYAIPISASASATASQVSSSGFAAGWISSDINTPSSVAQSGTASNTLYLKEGTATNSGTYSNSTAVLNGTTLSLTNSVTPDVTAGWVATGTAGSVTLSGTVPTQTKAASGAGTISPDSGYLLSSVTVRAGSAIPAATITDSSSTLTETTTVTKQYFQVTPTAAVENSGWISEINNGSTVNYKVQDGSASVTSISNFDNAITGSPTLDSVNNTATWTKAISTDVSGSATPGWISSVATGTVAGTITHQLSLYNGGFTSAA